MSNYLSLSIVLSFYLTVEILTRRFSDQALVVPIEFEHFDVFLQFLFVLVLFLIKFFPFAYFPLLLLLANYSLERFLRQTYF